MNYPGRNKPELPHQFVTNHTRCRKRVSAIFNATSRNVAYHLQYFQESPSSQEFQNRSRPSAEALYITPAYPNHSSDQCQAPDGDLPSRNEKTMTIIHVLFFLVSYDTWIRFATNFANILSPFALSEDSILLHATTKDH